MAELKPCPFNHRHGDDNLMLDYNSSATRHWVRCIECSAEGPAGRSRDKAIEAWNDRSTEPAPDTQEPDEPKISWQLERWERVNPVRTRDKSTMYRCKVHATLFDTELEPCWQCWNENR